MRKYNETYITCQYQNEQGDTESEDYLILLPSDEYITTASEEHVISDADHFTGELEYVDETTPQDFELSEHKVVVISTSVASVVVIIVVVLILISVLICRVKKMTSIKFVV